MTRRTGLIDGAVEALRARIVSGEWPVGTRIPPEPALVELLGVGRNTVREAVQSLAHSGLVERRQGSGTYVLSTSELAVSMGRHMVDARQRDVIEVRRALEVEAGRLAARRRSATDASTLLRCRDERSAAYEAGDMDRMVATDLALHRAVLLAAANPVLLTLYDNLIDAIGENIRFNFVGDTHGPHAHDGLIEAIVAGDVERAVEETNTYLSEFLSQHDEARPTAVAR
ncbi:FadR/GntR family transcriptional regulator [Cellulomonas marina]|uniref:DNA-binding transcriptional regulator, FadR family n=1 Tax=Cellulomonas marina TaxID=988821 RepID=A0A1I1AXI5_9CELL|nr:FadR/GntR family transcriptional regulator [Cellulomonas marina]GIG30261.1 GntR family transcriptional regulator [Cellulomonas marina]SFB40993.1 DNA-binding transcriptional regulator, FadR family [Cellulomonas marina]